MSKSILITGITGKQGGAILRALTSLPSSPFTLYGLTRSTTSPSSASLLSAHPGLKLVEGDLTDPTAVFAQLPTDLWGLFSIQSPYGKGVDSTTELTWGKDLHAAALKHGVKHIVYTSVDRGGPILSPTTPTPVPHFASKHAIELDLLSRLASYPETSYTILRPVAFMDNIQPTGPSVFFTAWKLSLREDQELQLIATSDIGRVGAQAFLHPTSPTYHNTALSLAGSSLTLSSALTAFKNATGHDVEFAQEGMVQGILAGNKEMGEMFKWFGEGGYGGDVVKTGEWAGEGGVKGLEEYLSGVVGGKKE